jgi:hypothetical protein
MTKHNRKLIWFVLTKFTGLHMNSQDFTGLHRTSQNFMGLHGTSQDFTGLHRTSQKFTRLHVITCEIFSDVKYYLQLLLPNLS